MTADALKDEILKDKGFNQYDLNFVKRRTGLKDERQALSLMEEEDDLGLIMEQLSSLPLVKRQSSRLSLGFLTLLLTHKYSEGNIKNKHKLMISTIASSYFNLIYNDPPKSRGVDFRNKPDEPSAKFLFVLSGFFGEYFAKFFNGQEEYEEVRQSHIKYIEAGLKGDGGHEWVSEGLAILEKISENGWLSRFMKKSKAL